MNAALRRLSQGEHNATLLMAAVRVQSGNTHGETIEIITSLVRGVGRNGQRATAVRQLSLQLLGRIQFDDLSNNNQLKYLRTMSLVWIRLGEPDDEERLTFLNRLDDQFPSHTSIHNRELCQVLVYLQSPTVVARTIDLLQQEPQRDRHQHGRPAGTQCRLRQNHQ